MAAPENLSARARQAITSGPIVISVASYWEVVIKAGKGQLEVGDPVDWWDRATSALGGSILSIRAKHISALAGLPSVHKDPFDRILMAQSIAEGLPLVTNDEAIGKYPVRTLW